MSKDDDIFQKVLEARKPISFRDIRRVLGRLGFELVRTSGSHHIYRHPAVPRPLNIQPAGHEAKPYQIKHFVI